MKPHPLSLDYNQTLQTLVSLKFYADTSAYGLSKLQPVQVYYANMSYDFFFQERGKCFDSALQPCFDSAQQPYFDSAQQPYFDSAQQPCFDSAQQPCFDRHHLGNVLTVISDKRMLVCNADTVTYSYASIISATDYSPFGAPLAGRTFSSESYRFRFNGMENDKETYGDGNALDFGARIYDSRLGRFLSIDLLFSNFPNESHYLFAGNNPVLFIDFNGLYKIHPDDLKSWQENYPLLLCYIQNEFGKDLTRDSELYKNLLLECKISKEELDKILSISGPNIVLGNLLGTAYTSQNGVTLDIAYLTNIEMVLKNPRSNYIERQAAMLTFYITMVHETVHVGYYLKNNEHDGTDGKTTEEVGDRFIYNNFGFNPSDAISIMNLPPAIDNTRTPKNERIINEHYNPLCIKAARCSVSQGHINKNRIETNKKNGDRTLIIEVEKEGSGLSYINRGLPSTP